MLFDIRINRDKVFDEVGRITAFIGSSNLGEDGTSIFNVVATNKYDKESLSEYWSQAASMLEESLAHYLVCAQYTHELLLRLDLPDNFNAAFMESINRSAFDFMVHQIIALWCGIKVKSEAEAYMQRATANLLDINIKVYTRNHQYA